MVPHGVHRFPFVRNSGSLHRPSFFGVAAQVKASKGGLPWPGKGQPSALSECQSRQQYSGIELASESTANSSSALSVDDLVESEQQSDSTQFQDFDSDNAGKKSQTL